MMALKTIILLITVALCCYVGNTEDVFTGTTSTTPASTDHSFSIEYSNAPDAQYEWDALHSLSEAYVLYPGDLSKIISAFAELYNAKHSGNWNVNAGCKATYVDHKNYTEIKIKVTDSIMKQ
ncbi:hypothetical protein NQ318_008962 [Aromia moschata]|uniref:Secreted protein n=1 Tax=Aromia moschata TaxID=1265417 RepID=A0AAV8ZAK0_9CUCU|nr:hypothetical protein NQ318_008962 [Aromia moschata]